MSDIERVRAWRQRLKDGGLVPMTVWVKPETEARYQDLALQSHRSGSELVQLALDAYRLDPALVSATATDTEQIHTIIREELDEAMAIMTATVTAIVTDTVKEMLPAMVQDALQPYVADTVPATETATPQEPRWLTTGEAFVSDMATATDTDTAGSALLQEPLVFSVSDTETDTATETTAPTGADPEAAAETSPAPRGRRTARDPARRRKAPTPSN
jgi:hypothetical protein